MNATLPMKHEPNSPPTPSTPFTVASQPRASGRGGSGDSFERLTAPYQPHSGTSRGAAKAIRPKLNARRERVLAEFRKAGAEGLTDDELIRALAGEMSTNTPRARRVDLSDEGLVVKAGTRLTVSGHPAVVWRLKEGA